MGPVESGGDVELSGFHDLDLGEKDEVMKVIFHYERRFKEICEGLDSIKVTLKKIHHTDRSDKYELHASVKDKNGHHEAHVIGRRLFIAVDEVLKKVENEISK